MVTALQRRSKWQPVSGYAIAVGTVGIAIVIRILLKSLFDRETPFLLLFASVLITAMAGGFGPGLLATLLGAIASNLSTAPLRIERMDGTEWMRLLLYFIEGLIISVIAARLQSARRRAEQSEAEARRLEQKILDISDAERRRFGQDLHDGLGQHLTGVAFLSKALQQRLAAKSLPEAVDATKIAALVNESIGQTRALAKGLAPVGLEDGGLGSALSQLASSTATVFGVGCHLHTDDALEVNDLAVSTHLYRIAQEAINNAIRHGKARNIDITMQAVDGRVLLSIEDDGVGITPKADPGGLGLQIMNFRARMVGGVLDVRRRASGGTAVVCSAPIVHRMDTYDHHTGKRNA
jgi:signal transduction histidine kinase